MKQVKMVVSGVQVDAVMFKTRSAAEKYRAMHIYSEYLFIQAGHYYVSK